MEKLEKFQNEIEANQELANTIIAFHIGRGGRFYNQGHKTFIKWGANINEYTEELFMTEDEKEYMDCSNSLVGLKVENDGTGIINNDNEYDTTYCVRLSEIDENEFNIICENEKNVWIPKEYSSLFIEEEKEEE